VHEETIAPQWREIGVEELPAGPTQNSAPQQWTEIVLSIVKTGEKHPKRRHRDDGVGYRHLVNLLYWKAGRCRRAVRLNETRLYRPLAQHRHPAHEPPLIVGKVGAGVQRAAIIPHQQVVDPPDVFIDEGGIFLVLKQEA
jgi:hypothetical protein